MKKIVLSIILILVGIYIKCQNPDTLRYELIEYAQKYLYVRETSINRSIEIDSFNTNVGVPLGSPWCASYISWVYNHFNIINPNSAWSPNWALKKDRIWDKNLKNNINIKQGDVSTFYYSNIGRVGHVEIIYKVDDKYIYTIGGNTDGSGNREGDGCYRKKRELSKVYAITRYIK